LYFVVPSDIDEVKQKLFLAARPEATIEKDDDNGTYYVTYTTPFKNVTQSFIPG
jgi:hypothetical protein